MLTLKCCGIRPHEWSQRICSGPAGMGLHCSHHSCCLQFCKIISYVLKRSKKWGFPASRKEENTSHWLIWPSMIEDLRQDPHKPGGLPLSQVLAREWVGKGTTVLIQNQLWDTNCAHEVWADALKTPCIPPSHTKRATMLCPSPGWPSCFRAVASPAVN